MTCWIPCSNEVQLLFGGLGAQGFRGFRGLGALGVFGLKVVSVFCVFVVLLQYYFHVSLVFMFQARKQNKQHC